MRRASAAATAGHARRPRGNSWSADRTARPRRVERTLTAAGPVNDRGKRDLQKHTLVKKEKNWNDEGKTRSINHNNNKSASKSSDKYNKQSKKTLQKYSIHGAFPSDKSAGKKAAKKRTTDQNQVSRSNFDKNVEKWTQQEYLSKQFGKKWKRKVFRETSVKSMMKV